MYFFDLADYYSGFQQSGWYNNNFSRNSLGCGGSLSPGDWEDYYGTARATSDAFRKAINTWFNASVSCNGFSIGSGCTNTYNDLYIVTEMAYMDFTVARREFFGTVMLYDYFYNYGKASGVSNPIYAGTYDEYIDYWVNTFEGGGVYFTGSTTVTDQIQNPYTNALSSITKTVNYGTAFTQTQLQQKVTNFDNTTKAYMCSLKNMLSVMDGDTFDELVYSGSSFNTTGINYMFS
jgi:hypothetical protein